ncbi:MULTISPECIES: hypothetical protein [unclassified Paraburkholderia]|uniref:hypothetical protein n=1 Tax=unclassified Paraburkholderia TaxID=2615204 RepID=UPI002AB03523|nr:MULTISPECIES: hypothetical protein [unclassified Paraburkholderia]
MYRRACALIAIAASAALGACGKPAGEEFVGKWANQKTKETVEISKNGDGFLLKDTTVNGFTGPMTSTVPATYEKGVMQVATGFGTMNVGYDRTHDVLIMPTMGGSVELSRAK